MTLDIALVFIILLIAIGFFVTEKLRVDIVALLVLGGLVVADLVTPEQAVSGFSNPAVVTVWAVFILSGGLSRTGIANKIGGQVLRLAGHSETRLLLVIMIISAGLSAFMNNIGVAAMFLPVILDISRQLGRSPAKFLLPLVYGTLLGGMTTLISTPANILVSNALQDAGLPSLGLFDFTPAGLVIVLAGTGFMVLVGRHLLPAHPISQPTNGNGFDPTNREELYGLKERLGLITLPPDSPLAGKTIEQSRIGQALGLTILGLQRQDHKQLQVGPNTILHNGDRLLALGRLDLLNELISRPTLIVEEDTIALKSLLSADVGVAEFRIPPDYEFIGRTLAQIDMRQQSGLNVLAIKRNGITQRTDLQYATLEAGDMVLVQGLRLGLESLAYLPEFRLLDEETAQPYNLSEQLLAVRIPSGSALDGKSLRDSRLASTYGLSALAIIRAGQTTLIPEPGTELQAEDTLIVGGTPEGLQTVRGLQGLQITRQVDMERVELESETVGLAEAMLSPYAALTERNLRELQFREKYGLNVLAIWRNGRAYRSHLGEMVLRFGDTLFLYGPRAKIKLLGQEPDFLVLQADAQEEPRYHKAWLAGLIMATVILVVVAGGLPISIAAIIGATLMVVSGCLTMDEAYRYIEWKAVFLIAGMLPLGIAMEQTGAARFLANGVVTTVGGFGPLAILAGLFILTTLATQFMPNPVVAVLMAPIALTTAHDLDISPYPFMLGIAFSASSSFLSPVGHPANVLVMGPGGYRFADYMKAGLPLAMVLLVITVVVVPLLWPF